MRDLRKRIDLDIRYQAKALCNLPQGEIIPVPCPEASTTGIVTMVADPIAGKVSRHRGISNRCFEVRQVQR